jgi:hypothetical protein
MQRTIGIFQALDGCDALAPRFVSQIRTGAYRKIFYQDSAGAADLNLAGNFGTVQVQLIAQDFGKGIRRLAVNFNCAPVQGELDLQKLILEEVSSF